MYKFSPPPQPYASLWPIVVKTILNIKFGMITIFFNISTNLSHSVLHENYLCVFILLTLASVNPWGHGCYNLYLPC